MYSASALFLFSLIALTRSASFVPRDADYKLNNVNYEPDKVNYKPINVFNEPDSVNYEPINLFNEPDSVSYEAGSVGYEPSSVINELYSVNYEPSSLTIELDSNSYEHRSEELTAFGYHMKIGVPKALELLKLEGVQSRIVGGNQVTSASAIPHQAGIVARLTTGWQSICGGSLISNTRVLTAAHCWYDGENQANLFTIVLGSLTIFTGGTRIETKDVVVHPSWNARAITNDIAMIKITGVTYNTNIQAIPLPTTADANLDFSGNAAVVSGYGKTSDSQASTPTTASLHQVSVTIITNAVCQRSFTTISLHTSHLCTSGTGRIGSCDGDSGGPLTTLHNNRRTLVGVVSFGLSEGCQFGNPSVFTRVTAFLSWITDNM